MKLSRLEEEKGMDGWTVRDFSHTCRRYIGVLILFENLLGESF